jgi:hypothetical protein
MQLDALEPSIERPPDSRTDERWIRIRLKARVAGQIGGTPAEQAMEWRVGGLPRDVPQRDIDGREGVSHEPSAPEHL